MHARVRLALTINENDSIKGNMKTIHTTIVFDYLSNRNDNLVINKIPLNINTNEQTLPRKVRRTLAQLRTGKSPFLNNYKHSRKIDPKVNITSNCPLCQLSEHNVQHLFTCTKLPTTLSLLDLWNNPVEVAALLEAWELRIGDVRDSAGWTAWWPPHAVEWTLLLLLVNMIQLVYFNAVNYQQHYVQ